MPVWHEATRRFRESKELVVLGVIQEQHAERCRLFAQWKNLDWPILHDPINALGVRAVPLVHWIDEDGVLRRIGGKPDQLQDWINEQPPSKIGRDPRRSASQAPASVLDADAWAGLRQRAQSENSAAASLALGDALVLWGKAANASELVQAYQRSAEAAPRDAAVRFRLGVALRQRYDQDATYIEDFQAAIVAWQEALDLDPNHYIYRRRLQQYGPRLNKPYPFYDWVSAARNDIRERGETPFALNVEPSGAELAAPQRNWAEEETQAEAPDPQGRITLDRQPLLQVAGVAAPTDVAPGATLRVHLLMSPTADACWNNESEPPLVWIDPPAGWRADRRLLRARQTDDRAESRERRSVEWELRAPPDAEGPAKLTGYVLFYACEKQGGQCVYRRHDFEVPLRVK